MIIKNYERGENMYKYEVRFTSIKDGEEFALEYLANVHWINDTDGCNRTILTCRDNIYQELMQDDRVVQFNWYRR